MVGQREPVYKLIMSGLLSHLFVIISHSIKGERRKESKQTEMMFSSNKL